MNGHNFGKLTSAFFYANIPNDKYGNGFRVLTALCYFAQGKDRCWPGLGRLCELTGIGSTDTIKKWLLRLRESDLIDFEDWAPKKKTVYRLSQRLLGQRNYPSSNGELSQPEFKAIPEIPGTATIPEMAGSEEKDISEEISEKRNSLENRRNGSREDPLKDNYHPKLMAELERVLIRGNGSVADCFFQLVLNTPRFFDEAVAPLLEFGRIPDEQLAKEIITQIHRHGSGELKRIWRVFQEAAETGDSSAVDRLLEDWKEEGVPAVADPTWLPPSLDLVVQPQGELESLGGRHDPTVFR